MSVTILVDQHTELVLSGNKTPIFGELANPENRYIYNTPDNVVKNFESPEGKIISHKLS